MEKSLSLKHGNREITFSDFDIENEIEIVMKAPMCGDRFFWLDKENVMSLKKHIDYLAEKIKAEQHDL
jgi:hypothetical protein